jgi:Trp operon repressor
VKDTVFVPLLTDNLRDVRNRITTVVALVDRDMLTRVWNEMDYPIDVCRITRGGNIEHL